MQQKSLIPALIRDENGLYSVVGQLTEQDLLDAAGTIIERRFQRVDVLTSPEASRQFLIHRLACNDREVFACIFLDNRHRVIAFEELFYGTIDGASVHPREVVKRALEHNAAAVIFAHNHPSGVAEPSGADERITRRLKEALEIVDVRSLDHIIVGGTETVSLAERGLM